MVLTFTKADLLMVPGRYAEPDSILSAVAQLGFGERIPPLSEIDPVLLEQGRQLLEEDFSDLISYLTAETRHFSVVYTSCFGILDGRRLGLAEFLRAVLPN